MSEAFVQLGLNQCFFGGRKFPHFFNLQTIILTHTKDFVRKLALVHPMSKKILNHHISTTCSQHVSKYIKRFSYLVYSQIWLNLLMDDR
jgi:hypothetical protein